VDKIQKTIKVSSAAWKNLKVWAAKHDISMEKGLDQLLLGLDTSPVEPAMEPPKLKPPRAPRKAKTAAIPAETEASKAMVGRKPAGKAGKSVAVPAIVKPMAVNEGRGAKKVVQPGAATLFGDPGDGTGESDT